jgi:hypothetical protein
VLLDDAGRAIVADFGLAEDFGGNRKKLEQVL